jgi:hypothetical protein
MPLQKKLFEEQAANMIKYWWIDLKYKPGSKYVVNVIQKRFDSMKAKGSLCVLKG